MIDIEVILGIIFIHWIADFVCQTDKQATGKSKNWDDLLSHTLTYTMVWIPALFIYGMFNNLSLTILWFIPITFACHTATDYYTSRVNAILWEKKDVHSFFVAIGFDQWLHYTQLFLTYLILR